MRDQENIRGSPRLLFTKEELESPELEKPIAKVQRAQKKVDSMQKKLMKHQRMKVDQQPSSWNETEAHSADSFQPAEHAADEPVRSNRFRSGHGELRPGNQPEVSAGTDQPNPGSAKSQVRNKAAVQKQTAMPGKASETAKGHVEKLAADKPQTASPRLIFEETVSKRPSKMKHPSQTVRMINTEIHRHAASANEDENVAAKASLQAEEKVESALRMGDHVYHARKAEPYRKLEKAEKKLDQANIKYLQAAKQNENPTFSSNPYSRWQQKRAIRKEYAAAKAGKGSSAISFNNSRKKAEEAVSETKAVVSKIAEAVKKRPGKLVLLGLSTDGVFCPFGSNFPSLGKFRSLHIPRQEHLRMAEQEASNTADALFHAGVVLEGHQTVFGTFRRNFFDRRFIGLGCRRTEKVQLAEQVHLSLAHHEKTPS